jgi:hypothetical protein
VRKTKDADTILMENIFKSSKFKMEKGRRG